MNKKKEAKRFLNSPFYKGGKSALQKFIKANLVYPPKALEAQTEGIVYLKYSIDYKGNVINAKVIKSLGYGCDEEAIRLTRLLKFETTKTRKIKVRYHKHIKIHFRLPKRNSDDSEPAQINYQYQPSKEKKTHSYTINITY